MGMINFGVPEKIALQLAQTQACDVFIETGTYRGDTARWAANFFAEVHTIENSPELYAQYGSVLEENPRIHAHCGDSRQILPELLKGLGQKRALYWLDSHWFGGDTGGGENDQCPLLAELACLAERPQDVILIDDARLFLAAPPMPHNPALWPTILEVMKALPKSSRDPFVQIVDDVIFVVPDEVPLRDCLTSYAKRRSNKFWQAYQQQAEKNRE